MSEWDFMGQKQQGNEQECNHLGVAYALFEIATENTDDDIANQTHGNTVENIVGEGHYSHAEEGGDTNPEVIPVNVFDRTAMGIISPQF